MAPNPMTSLTSYPSAWLGHGGSLTAGAGTAAPPPPTVSEGEGGSEDEEEDVFWVEPASPGCCRTEEEGGTAAAWAVSSEDIAASVEPVFGRLISAAGDGSLFKWVNQGDNGVIMP